MRRTAVPLLAVLVALSACGGGGDDESTGTTPGTTPGTSVTAPGTSGTGSSGDVPTGGVTSSGGSETSGEPGGTSSGGVSGSSSTGDATNVTTVDPGGSSSSSSGGAVDCSADCKSCWDCAKEGACKGVYDACANAQFCIPSLSCIGSMCTPDGITPECTTTCCMGCVNLMTCPEVNAAVSCIQAECAGLCGGSTCPG